LIQKALDEKGLLLIVAGEDCGANLHYIRNDQDISDGSLVLVDESGSM